MSLSKQLSIIDLEKEEVDPFVAAKNKLIQNLQIQLNCAEAMIKGQAYTVPSAKTVTVDQGNKKTIAINQAPRHWYWRDGTGNVRFFILIFNKRIEFENNKTDILVGKDTELPKTVKAILDAAIAGEFDAHIKRALAD